MPIASRLKELHQERWVLGAAPEGKDNIRPPAGGQKKRCSRFAAHSPPGVPPAPKALHGVGLAAPRPPGLRPLSALRRPGPCYWLSKELLSTEASEARQAEGKAPVGKVAPEWVHVVNAKRCPHVPMEGQLVHQAD